MTTAFTHLRPFGAETAAVDARDLTEGDVAAIRSALADQGVLVLRGQEIDDAAFVTFLEALGEMTFTKGETPLDGFPMLNRVTNVGRTTKPRSVFHTDTSYVAEPPAYTALRAVDIPAQGGATVFSNQYAAYDTLDASLKARLAGARVRHQVTGLADKGIADMAIWHPLFRRHPLSRRTALFLSTPERCTGIEGIADDEAVGIIARLFAHSTRDEALCRHAWRPGDIVIWDNRCTMHKADHSGVVGDRTLHRGMVAGEAPLAA